MQSAYLGPLGGLVRFSSFQGGLSTSSERSSVDKVTTSGVRRVQVAQRVNRSWDVSGKLWPEDFASLAAIVAGEFDIGPFWFVDPWAQVTNLMAPRASTLEGEPPSGMTVGGPVNLADGGRAGRSWVVANPNTIHHVNLLDGVLHRVPVVADKPVSGTVFASGTAVDVRLQWYDAGSDFLSNTGWSSHSPGAVMRRVWRYDTPPAGAHSVVVQARGANRIARPALTWTDRLVDWHVGQGAPSVAIPASLAQDIIMATRDANGGRYASVSTTIREVG